MKLEITEQNKKPLLDREEVVATLNFEGATPSKKEVRAEIAKQTKAKEELVIVKDIYNFYGETKAEVSAYVYKDEKSMKETELPWAIARNEGKKKDAEGEETAEGDAPAEAPAEGGDAPAEEAPKEEPKKEAPAEEPKEEEKAEEPKEEKPVEKPKGEE